MTKPIRYLILGSLVSVLLFTAVAFALPKPESDGLVIGEDVPFYSMPWNDEPFYPGELQTTDGHLANWETVPSAEYCAQCHEKEYREWVSSIHSVSGPDIVYETAIGNNEEAHISRLGTEKIRWCDSCHEPINTLIGEVNPIPVVGPNAAAAEGTSCIACHAVVDAEPLVGNGALTLDINSINQYDEALIMVAPAEHARAMQAKTHNPLMGSSDMCGACHTEIRPPDVNGHEPMHLQDTYDEWRRSEYADMGIQCQDCHMHPDPASYIAELKETGEMPERVVSHRFVGVNYLLTAADLPSNLITFLRGGHPPGDITTEEWKEDLLVQQGLIIDLLQEAADLEVAVAETAVSGQEISLDVLITNSGAGHELPTGPLDQRHMWVEVKVTDATGNIVYNNGWFDGEVGQVDPEATIYLKIITDATGERIVEHILFDAHELEYTRDPILPHATDTIPYSFTVPEGTDGPLTVEVTLWYRLALQELVTYSLGLDVIVPPIIMEQTTATIEIKN
ncbi:MAG TPA: hypothetical protein EYP90_08850 [Chromatiaceae bacterium]|nr:hypothetical protein [Chromatiaceae bacterium]